jgi:hypothetical protein
LQVWVRRAGSSALYDAWAAASFTVVAPLPLAVSLQALPASRRVPAGTATRFSATTSGGTPPLEYQFVRQDSDGWHIVQPYSPTSSSYVYTPSSAHVGPHAIQVWVRTVGATVPFEAWAGTTYEVTAPPPIAVGLSQPSLAAVRAGETLTFRASAAGGVGPLEYQFVRLDPDGWKLVQPYGTNETYSWTPAASDRGAHLVQVWVRSHGSSATYEAWRGTAFFTVYQANYVVLDEASPPPDR